MLGCCSAKWLDSYITEHWKKHNGGWNVLKTSHWLRSRTACMLLVLSALVPVAQAGNAMAPIADVAWLTKNLEAPDLLLVDVRLKEDFALEHIKGAVSIPYPELFAEGHLIPGLDRLRELFSAAGIDNRSRGLIYDDGSFIWAARAYWLFETLGQTNVSMLGVGYGNWEPGTVPVTDAATEVARGHFVPTVDHRRLETKLSTRLAIDNDRRLIMDGRSWDEYMGKDSRAIRFGHIPSAIHSSWANNYVESPQGNLMRSLPELAQVYEGIDPEREIVVYCNGGAQSALNYVVLQALGYQVSVYDGSWFEWGNDLNVPIVNPSAQ